MYIISFEGLDKSGKKTQSQKLAEHLTGLGHIVVQSEFPRYDTPTGQMIREWLTNDRDVDQATFDLIQAADKQAQQKWFQSLENQGTDFLILDRYIHSGIAYGAAAALKDKTSYLYDNKNTQSPTSWLHRLYEQVRRPDYTLFIWISAEESMKRKGKHGDNDRYESDLDLLQAVNKTYAQEFNIDQKGLIYDHELPEKLALHRKRIDGMQPIEKIQEEITAAVIKRFHL